MSTVSLSSKYQIVIPKEIRQSLSLKAGALLDVISLNGKIELIPVKPITELRGFLADIDTSVIRDEEDRV